MLSKLIRVLLALTAIAPLSVSLAYVFAIKGHNVKWAVAAMVVCLMLGIVAHWVIKQSKSSLERLPITIKKAKSSDKEVIGFFLAYALPLIFRGDANPDFVAWGVAAALLLFVLWSTHSVQVNPLLGLMGYHFYEVETADGITYLLITRKRINNALTVRHVVQLSEHGILEANGV